jgi:hypothetical protein
MTEVFVAGAYFEDDRFIRWVRTGANHWGLQVARADAFRRHV